MTYVEKEIERQTREYGFDKAEYWLKWEGCDIYCLTPDGQDSDSGTSRPLMGPPFLLLVKGNEVRLADPREWIDILIFDKLNNR